MLDRSNYQSVQHSTLLGRDCIVVEAVDMLVEYNFSAFHMLYQNNVLLMYPCEYHNRNWSILKGKEGSNYETSDWNIGASTIYTCRKQI